MGESPGLPGRGGGFRARIREIVRQLALRLLELSLRPPVDQVTLALLRGGVRRWPKAPLLPGVCWHAGRILGRHHTTLRGRLRTGSIIHLLARDHGHRYVYFYGTWEEPTTNFFHSVARTAWTVLDVGANVGYYSLLARDLGGPSSSVHAFEPNPELSTLIARSASDLRPGALTVVRAAVGDREGSAPFHLSNDLGNSGLSSLRSDVMSESQETTVEMLTLDGYCAAHDLKPDVIKIDVEGCEVQVLEGARRLLGDGVVQYLVCEFEPRRAPAEPLVDLLGEYGYTARAITPTGGLTTEIDQEFQNLVFIRQGG